MRDYQPGKKYFLARLAEVSNDDLSLPWDRYPCLLWEWGKRKPTTWNYGCFGKTPRRQAAHRAAYALVKGEIPPGKFVCHHCDTPACFRPAHLFAGTSGDNMRDKAAKGRSNIPRGSLASNARLTEEQVLEIRRLSALRTMSQDAIGKKFSVTQSYVSEIFRRKKWAHL